MSTTFRDTHEYCWGLLPWFVTGRLSSEDSARIERHLTECIACRDELEVQRELCMHFRRDESVLLAPQGSLQKMLARIDADAATAPTEKMLPALHTTNIDTSTPTRRRPPRWLAIAAGAQTIAIGVLLALLWRQTSDVLTAPRFATLTSSSSVPERGVILRIVFKDTTTAEQMLALLRSVRAQVIAGPTEAGVYTVRLDERASETDSSNALSQVRANQNVIFAERVSTEQRP